MRFALLWQYPAANLDTLRQTTAELTYCTEGMLLYRRALYRCVSHEIPCCQKCECHHIVANIQDSMSDLFCHVFAGNFSWLNRIFQMASGKGQYLIAGVHLPNSESFSGHSDIEVSTSLGHCAHLVNMLATFLDVPLQYPIEYRGSRSLIYDMIIESPATNKDRS